MASGPAKPAAFSIRYYEKTKSSLIGKLTHSIAKRFNVFGIGEQLPRGDNFFADLKSDVLLCFGVRNDTAKFVRAAKDSGKHSVVFLTSDRNVEDAARRGHRKRGIYGEIGHFCRYALKNADRVVAQTPFQQEQLKQQLHIDSRLIRNPIDLDHHVEVDAPHVPVVLWVGRADTFSKRADACLEIAKRCPSLRFRMVMNNHNARTFEQIQHEAPGNVKIVERVPFDEIEQHFAASTLLLNTSSAEGFPNAFLQAAKYGKPIVSLTVDPGEMLSSHGCGVSADGDLERASAFVQRLCDDRVERLAYAQRATKYVGEFHRLEDRCVQLDAMLGEMLDVATHFSKRAA